MSILEDLWFDNLVVLDVESRKGSEQEKALAGMVRSAAANKKTPVPIHFLLFIV